MISGFAMMPQPDADPNLLTEYEPMTKYYGKFIHHRVTNDVTKYGYPFACEIGF